MNGWIQVVVFVALFSIVLQLIKKITEKQANEEFDLYLKRTGQTKEEYQRKITEELE